MIEHRFFLRNELFCVNLRKAALPFFFSMVDLFVLITFHTTNLNSIASNWLVIQFWDFIKNLKFSRTWKQKKISINKVSQTSLKLEEEIQQ
jgi:hypothetical protein